MRVPFSPQYLPVPVPVLPVFFCPPRQETIFFTTVISSLEERAVDPVGQDNRGWIVALEDRVSTRVKELGLFPLRLKGLLLFLPFPPKPSPYPLSSWPSAGAPPHPLPHERGPTQGFYLLKDCFPLASVTGLGVRLKCLEPTFLVTYIDISKIYK